MSAYSTIRVAEKSDHSSLIEIWEDAVKATHNFLLPEDFDYFRGQIPQYLSQVELYVCEEEGVVEGFLGVSGQNIEMLFIRKRGVGLGSRLLRFAVEELGAIRVDVNQQNVEAHRFYLKHGFIDESSSETDSSGRPYPINQMVLKD